MIKVRSRIIALGIGLSLAGAAAPAIAAGPPPAGTLEQAAATLGANDWYWQDNGADAPLTLVVSVADQRAYVYRGASLIAVSSVSTGKDGKETPVGVYPVLQKEVMHHSNLYNDAAMPYMQRLTWDGIALHAGKNPGFPASHGCVRMPASFAKKLFAATKVGTVVNVTETSVVGDAPDLLPADVIDTARYERMQSEAEATARANATQLSALD